MSDPRQIHLPSQDAHPLEILTLLRKNAETLFFDYMLKSMEGNYFQIVELEFYICHSSHLDLYVHRGSRQKKYGRWYFHRAGNSWDMPNMSHERPLTQFRSGSRKGLDVTFGNETTFAGVLIRSIRDIKTDEVTEGPCLTVEKLLHIPATQRFSKIFNKRAESVEVQGAFGNPIVGLYPAYFERENILQGPRVNLNPFPKNQHKFDYQRFCTVTYRFAIASASIKKLKNTLIPVKIG